MISIATKVLPRARCTWLIIVVFLTNKPTIVCTKQAFMIWSVTLYCYNKPVWIVTYIIDRMIEALTTVKLKRCMYANHMKRFHPLWLYLLNIHALNLLRLSYFLSHWKRASLIQTLNVSKCKSIYLLLFSSFSFTLTKTKQRWFSLLMHNLRLRLMTNLTFQTFVHYQ